MFLVVVCVVNILTWSFLGDWGRRVGRWGREEGRKEKTREIKIDGVW